MSTPRPQWTVDDVSCLVYEVGNEHRPTSQLGRQVLTITPNDTFELTWIRRGDTRRCTGRLHAGRAQRLLLALHDAGFPNIPSFLPAPPGTAFGDYRLVCAGATHAATTVPHKATEVPHLSTVQTAMDHLTRRLANDAPSTDPTWIAEQQPWSILG
ncbi:MAG: hypothetical protein ACON5B_11220 [Myxococcota bacterium]